jgi:hypothetical protein
MSDAHPAVIGRGHDLHLSEHREMAASRLMCPTDRMSQAAVEVSAD